MELKHFKEKDKKGIAGSSRNNYRTGFFGSSHGEVVIGAGGPNPIDVKFRKNNNSPNKASMSLSEFDNLAKVAAAAHVNGYNKVIFSDTIPDEPIQDVRVKPKDKPDKSKNQPKPRQQTKPKDISLREFVIGLILVFILLRFFLTYVLFGIAVCFFLKVSVSDVISKVRKVLDR